ncbi:RHS repeat-associated core domain-containing protein [Pseudomonas reinekei]|uniref:RHS repeat-associated core domain-containing protein n=1 Tax=Pseudomonas reinekei TaxID=395598 RepID=A0A1H0N8B8_PSERE|nr:RHS repeat-associated core domain-containing protein [Pseudomonas reinekei]
MSSSSTASRPKHACPFYYHLDHLGTPQELTDYSGEIVWSARYTGYGKVSQITHGGGEQLEQPLRFQGQYFDAESGLHYNRHRYYHPDTGRYLTPDPVKLAGGLNAYRYTPNPTGWVDPLGLSGNCPGGDGCKSPSMEDQEPSKKTVAIEGEPQIPSAGYHKEVFADKPVKPQEATSKWEEFLGEGPYTNKHPRTSTPDPDRLVSADGTRSIRYGAHEMGGNPSKHHYHEERWMLELKGNVMNVENTVVRVPLAKKKQ